MRRMRLGLLEGRREADDVPCYSARKNADEEIIVAGEPADIAASEDSLEPNMIKDPKVSEFTAFVQENTKQMMAQRLEILPIRQ